MNRTLPKLVVGIILALLSLPSDVLAGRGGGYRGGGGGYGGGYRGPMGGGSMGHSPAFSQPRPSGSYGNRSPYGNPGASSHNAGAAAGAGYANRNQSAQLAHPGAAGAAAGAGYANRNPSSEFAHPGAVGAAAGAGYANNRYGTWNGNHYAGWGATGWGLGYPSGVGAWGVGTPMYGWGYSGYSNPYYGGGYGSAGVPQTAAAQQPTAAAGPDYSQPISTTAAVPEQAVASQAASAYDQALAAFKAGDYAQAVQLDQQALAQTPNDTALHEFLALAYFAQAKYPQAAAPLYAVLSVRPGWDWTTLSGMYPDVDTYTAQLRALEAYVRSNPASAPPRFVLAYQYLTQGHDPEAIAQLKEVVRLQPGDTLSAQIIAAFQPSGGNPPPPVEPAPAAAPVAQGKLAGTWTATPAPGAKVALAIQDDGSFTWTATGPGKPAMEITGKSTLADDILTLTAQSGQNGALVGRVTWQDAGSFTFRLVGGPPNDPGLKFSR
jgi:hypothetical protein